MSELSAQAKKLLVQIRDVDDPTPDERSIGDAAVRRMLRAQGVHNLPPLAPQPLAAPSGATVKLSWVVGAALIATLGMFNLWRSPGALPTAQVQEPAARPVTSPAPQPEAAPGIAPGEPSSAPASIETLASVPLTAVPHRKHDRPARDSLAEELRFVSSVDAEIRAGAYDRALRRLQLHKGPRVLQEERAAMRVLALCGRNADAHARRAREQFLKMSPSSVLAARVRAACVGEPSP